MDFYVIILHDSNKIDLNLPFIALSLTFRLRSTTFNIIRDFCLCRFE